MTGVPGQSAGDADYWNQWTRARALIESQRTDRALDLLTDLLREHPEHAGDVHRTMSWALTAAGRLDAAEREARIAIAIDPELFDAHMALANALFEQRRFREATQPLTDAVRLRPASAGAHSMLAQCFSRAGRPAQAWAASEEALRLAPGSVDAHFAAGYVAMGEHPYRARQHFLQALAIDPRHEASLHNLSVLDAREGHPLLANQRLAAFLATWPLARLSSGLLGRRLVRAVHMGAWWTRFVNLAMVVAMTFHAPWWTPFIAVGVSALVVVLEVLPVMQPLPHRWAWLRQQLRRDPLLVWMLVVTTLGVLGFAPLMWLHEHHPQPGMWLTYLWFVLATLAVSWVAAAQQGRLKPVRGD